MVLTKGMPNGREICIFLVFHGRYVMFDVKKKNGSFLKVQSLKREPYLRKSFVGFFTSVVEINGKNKIDFNAERNAMAAN